MTPAQDVSEILADARTVQTASIERLEAGDIRDASEKAWCAIRRATDALILARTGTVPEKSPATTRGLRTLAAVDAQARSLLDRYYASQSALHGDCFYLGLCEPVEDTVRLIRGAAGYIADAGELVGQA